jgi:hypothetical protein
LENEKNQSATLKMLEKLEMENEILVHEVQRAWETHEGQRP